MIPVNTTALLIESCYSSFYRFHSLIKKEKKQQQQIKEQCSKVARGSWALNQLKHFVDEQTLRSVYHCLIYSHLQYCISSWGTASKSTLAPLFILQKRSIRLLTGSGYHEHT